MGRKSVLQSDIRSKILILPQSKICNLLPCVCIGKCGIKHNDLNIFYIVARFVHILFIHAFVVGYSPLAFGAFLFFRIVYLLKIDYNDI